MLLTFFTVYNVKKNIARTQHTTVYDFLLHGVRYEIEIYIFTSGVLCINWLQIKAVSKQGLFWTWLPNTEQGFPKMNFAIPYRDHDYQMTTLIEIVFVY
jgi:hypothetical protein